MIAAYRIWAWAGWLVTSSVASLAAADVGDLIERLDSPEFSERQEASRLLADLGPEAFPTLERTVAAGSREASLRALDLLKQQFQHGDLPAKDAAREALSRLADSNNVTTAQRARDVLNPPVERTAVTPWGGIPNGQPPQVNFARVNFGGVPAGNLGAVRRVSYSEINGRRGVEISERDRVVKMETWPGGSIEITITERVNGRNVERKVIARDRDDLARKDAESAKLYDEYHRRGGAPLGGVAPGFPPPGFPPPGFGPNMPVHRGPLSHTELTKRHLGEIEGMIERYKARLPNDAATQRMIESLERSKQRYKEMMPLDAPQEVTRRPLLR
jgi:hypothetical protein